MSKDHARTHDENRLTICLLCFGRTKEMFAIKGQLKKYVEKFYPNYSDDNSIPGALCSTCQRDIYRAKNDMKELKKFPDLSQFYARNTSSQNDSKCSCHLCELSRKFQSVYFPPKKGKKRVLSDITQNAAPSKFVIFS